MPRLKRMGCDPGLAVTRLDAIPATPFDVVRIERDHGIVRCDREDADVFRRAGFSCVEIHPQCYQAAVLDEARAAPLWRGSLRDTMQAALSDATQCAYATHGQATSARAQFDKCSPVRVGDDQDREYTTEVQGLPASDAAYQAIRRAAQIGEGRRVRVVRGVAVGVYP